MIIEEHIMKRYTLGLVIGIVALGSFIMYKTPTMTMQNPPSTTAPSGPSINEADKKNKADKKQELAPLVVLVTNETDKNVTIEGVFSSLALLYGTPGVEKSSPVQKTVPKNSKDFKIIFEPIPGKGYDRLEVRVKPIAIIHTLSAPKTEQTVIIK
jgi:hypothetical protein